MKDDELLMKLLDGGLSTAEQRLLNERMASSADFGREVQELVQLEQSLRSEGDHAIHEFEPLRAQVERSIKSKIQSQSLSSAGAAGFSAGMGKLMTWAVAALTGSLAVWLAISWQPGEAPSDLAKQESVHEQIKAPEVPAPVPTPADPIAREAESAIFDGSDSAASAPVAVRPDGEAIVPVVEPDVVESDPVLATNEPAQEAEGQDTLPAQVVSPPPPSSERNARGSAPAPPNSLRQRYELEIRQLEEAMEESLRAGDVVKAAITETKIGRLQRDLRQIESSRRHLLHALAVFESGGHSSLAARAYGDLGLLEAESGDLPQALRYLERCIQIYDSLDSGEMGKWQRQLSTLQRQHASD